MSVARKGPDPPSTSQGGGAARASYHCDFPTRSRPCAPRLYQGGVAPIFVPPGEALIPQHIHKPSP